MCQEEETGIDSLSIIHSELQACSQLIKLTKRGETQLIKTKERKLIVGMHHFKELDQGVTKSDYYLKEIMVGYVLGLNQTSNPPNNDRYRVFGIPGTTFSLRTCALREKKNKGNSLAYLSESIETIH